VEMECAGFLLKGVTVSQVELTSFGRLQWTFTEDPSRPGHMRSFNVRAGSPVALARQDRKTGAWSAIPGATPGFVAWSRRATLSAIFPPGAGDDSAGGDDEPAAEAGDRVSLLACPDSVTPERLRVGLRWCQRLDPADPPYALLAALLGPGNPQQSRTGDGPGTAAGEKGAGEESDGLLNEEQRRAVRLCCGEGWAGPVGLIHGPFGTGKTRTLVEIIR
jgi:hypothetical protein